MQTQTEPLVLVLYTDGKILTGLRKLLDRENIQAKFLSSELFYNEIHKTLEGFRFGAVIVDDLFRKYIGLVALRKLMPGSDIFLIRESRQKEPEKMTISHLEGFTEDVRFDCAIRSQCGLFLFALKHSIVDQGTVTSDTFKYISHRLNHEILPANRINSLFQRKDTAKSY